MFIYFLVVHITCFLLGLTSAHSLNTVSEIIAEVRATDLCVVLWVLEKPEVKSQQKERLKMVTFLSVISGLKY